MHEPTKVATHEFVVTSLTGSLLGSLLRALVEQRFPGSVCATQVEPEGDASVARVVNVVSGSSLWVFASPPEQQTVQRLAANGAVSAIDLGASRSEIESALSALESGGIFLSKALTPDSDAGQLNATLTPREREVARLVGQGLANAEIAAELGVSTHTIRTHLQSIYLRLGVQTRGKLAARVRDVKLWDPRRRA